MNTEVHYRGYIIWCLGGLLRGRRWYVSSTDKTFYTQDGAKAWIDGQLLLNQMGLQ